MATHHESSVDVLLIGAGPAGLMAALWMSRCGIKTRMIDRRGAQTRVGQADGIQCRSLEVFDSFGVMDQIWKESNHMVEMCIWNPGPDGNICRSSRMANTIPGVSRFPQGVLLSQHRIEEILLNSLAQYTNVEIQRGVTPTQLDINHFSIDDDEAFPVSVTICKVEDHPAELESLDEKRCSSKASAQSPEHADLTETIRAKYVIGCDGAHSWTRKQLGLKMEGEQTDHIWGVLDIIPVTDFPDIRSRCAIRSAKFGSIMLIPRENKLVRIYCQLSTITPGQDGRFDRSQVSQESIFEAAKRIMSPYTLEYKYCDWWTVYQVGQRVGNHFGIANRVFLAGDAVHTHSPKAGQGMNVSLQDCYNLGWKIALVVKGIAKRSLLDTYETERRSVAKNLIAFDSKFSRMFASRPAKDAADETGISMEEFKDAFLEQKLFSAGFTVEYSSNMLIANDRAQHLAANIPIGRRFPSFPVVNQSDARLWHLASWLKADGRFRLILFAGDVSEASQMQRVRRFADKVEKPTSLLRQYTRKGKAVMSAIDILTVHSASREQIELFDFPDLLHPFDSEIGWAYDKIFANEGYYHGKHEDAYLGYGVDKREGCLVLVRPDQHVGWIGKLEDVGQIEDYFLQFLDVRKKLDTDYH